MTPCRNTTCDRYAVHGAYCSRVCQLADRNTTGLNYVRVGISSKSWHRLFEMARREGMTVAEWIAMLADEEAANGG